MKINEEINKISLSSWNYGSFSIINPFYQKNKLECDTNKENENKVFKIVKKEYFDNKPYSDYINREIEIKNKLQSKTKKQREEDLEWIKNNGKTFDKWKSQKNLKIRKEKLLNQKQKEKSEKEQLKEKEREKNNRKTFKQWEKEIIEKKKKEEEKRINNENKLMAVMNEVNKQRKVEMKKWKKEKSELIKKRKEIENKAKEEKKVEEEKYNKEKKEENKIAFINWLNNKIKENKSKKQNEKNNNNKNNLNKRIKTKEIIGPFYYAKDLREAQKSYYDDINKRKTSF